MCTHTHTSINLNISTHAYTRTYTHPHTHTHTLSLSLSLSHTHTHTNDLTHAFMHTRAHIHLLKQANRSEGKARRLYLACVISQQETVLRVRFISAWRTCTIRLLRNLIIARRFEQAQVHVHFVACVHAWQSLTRQEGVRAKFCKRGVQHWAKEVLEKGFCAWAGVDLKRRGKFIAASTR